MLTTLHHTTGILEIAESSARGGGGGAALRQLRRLCLDDFAVVVGGMPDDRYPGLSSVLPAMAPDDVQRSWTGASGRTLLGQRVAFIEKLRRHYLQITGKSLDGARILDYGCGYGLMLRLLLYLADPERITGCDPSDRAIRLCQEAGIRSRLDLTDYLPEALPYAAETFDLVLAYSVFTHTSRRASIAALEAIHPAVKPGGLLVLTIRPRELWAYRELHQQISERERAARRRAHDRDGFAYWPSNRPPIDGDVTYGNTTMKITTLEALCPKWRVVGYDRSLHDPFQIVVLLQPRTDGDVGPPPAEPDCA